MPRAMDEVRLLLRSRRHVAYDADDDFDIETNASFLSIWGSISGAFFGDHHRHRVNLSSWSAAS